MLACSPLVASVDIVDETFLAVAPGALAQYLAERDRWPHLWPDLRLQVYADRGEEGLRCTVQGALVGTMELWLEPMLDGTLLHYFLRVDPPQPLTSRRLRREIRRRQLQAKRISLGLKRRLEADRPIGVGPAGATPPGGHSAEPGHASRPTSLRATPADG